MELPPSGRRGRVFSIAPRTPFLKQLATALVDGRLVDGFRPADDPLALTRAIVYLPTRRAARAFGAEIVAALGSRAALLPDIRTLGDSDEEELALAFAATEGSDLPPAAGHLERQLKLAAMVRGWTTALSRATRELLGDEDIVVPSSATDAFRLAGDLARLIDQMETEEVPFSSLDGVAGEDHARWWDLTFTFLKIVGEHWPRHLAETGRLDPAARRRQLLDLRSRQLAAGAGGPVIAAGSTGSIPAAARLLQAIAAHEQGAVVLPGVDFELPEPVWRSLAEPGGEEEALQASTHPQYGLARLVRRMGLAREEIVRLGEEEAGPDERRGLISLALLPASATVLWRAAERGVATPALEGIAVIEAPGEREEALAIAVAMREALERPGMTAALTTPDRALARRVAAELGRFGIAIDDSAGTPLVETPAGRLARSLVFAATQPGDPVRLAALLKDPALHDATRAPSAGEYGAAARLFELAVLRDSLVVPAPGELEAAARRASELAARNRFAPPAVQRMGEAEWQAAFALGRHTDAATRPLTALAGAGELDPAEAVAAIRRALAIALKDGEGERLLGLRGGRELAGLFEAFDSTDLDGGGLLKVPFSELGEFFLALCRDVVVRDIRHSHGRLHIFGPLEARLQHVDRMILGGLNEGGWPAPARNDAFLNRPMKGQLGLSFPERRIGLAAHDFQQFAGSSELFLTRALKAENAPTVASRWLQRLMAVAGEAGRKTMLALGNRYVELADTLDRPDAAPARVARPNPRPPVALRPTRLSITEIETWIRDPYAIHARHILGLAPLPPLEREADPALRGALYHEVMAIFIRGRTAGEDAAAALWRLRSIAGNVFRENAVPPEVQASWLPRLGEIGRLLIAWEEERDARVARRSVEVSGSVEVGDTGFVLRGRADRIDRFGDGSVEIIDYKTGTTPSAKQARSLSPQLALEAQMAWLGAFGEENRGPPAELAYVRLRAGDELRIDCVSRAEAGLTAPELARDAWARLDGLIAAYAKPGQGYLSRFAVMREGETGGTYDHLARVLEWSVGESEDDGE